jgi:exonuclease SbcC
VRILSLSLENIKSYAEPTVVHFTQGLNAVSGGNGAGKTTVLEAIGFALFDYLPYPHGAFVREGQKFGTVRVRILAPDEREYEILRRVGSSARWTVTDVETEMLLAERGESVKLWIRTEVLNVEGEVDLAALFENAVGVPQGTMTGDFLRTAVARKGVFDPLLRVEEYRGAWENLRDTLSYLKDRSADLREEIGRLEGETERIAEVERVESTARTDLEANARLIVTLEADLARIDRDKSELDRREAALVAAEGEVVARDYDLRRQTDVLADRERKRDDARSAHMAVAQSRDGYGLVRAAQDRLKALERDRQTRDGHRAALAKVKGQRDGTARQIERLIGEARAAREDRNAADALTPQVDEQSALEARIETLSRSLAARVQLETDAGTLEGEIAARANGLVALKARIADAQSASAESAALDGIAGELRTVEAALLALRGLEQQLAETQERGVQLRKQLDTEIAGARRAAALAVEMTGLRAEAESVLSARAQHTALREELVGISATLDFQDLARRDLEARHCPLLQLDCPAVTADRGVLVRFDNLVHTMVSRREALAREIELRKGALDLAEAAAARLQGLEVEHALVSGAQARAAEIEPELLRCRKQFADFRESLSSKPELEAREVDLKRTMSRLEERRTLALSLPVLRETLSADEAALQTSRARLAEMRTTLAAMSTLDDDLVAARQRLLVIGNPRAEQLRLAASAARLPALEAQLLRERKSHEGETVQFNEIQEALQAFETLDAQIDEQYALVETHRPAYEAYLRYSEEAAALDGRERAVSEAAAVLQVAAAAHASALATRDEATAAYDATRHGALKTEYQETYASLATTGAQGDRLRAELARAERELRELRIKRDRLRARRTEQDEMGRVARTVDFIRETIRAAGPAVTEMLLATISQEASDIFSEIMDDHSSELRWESDYEIVVQRGAETRKFNQLSGGEQMSAALAVRLALLREMSGVDFAFFDEPTQNMDDERRSNLASQIAAIRGFEQLIVISHDDTFEHQTDNLVRLAKQHDSTRVEST